MREPWLLVFQKTTKQSRNYKGSESKVTPGERRRGRRQSSGATMGRSPLIFKQHLVAAKLTTSSPLPVSARPGAGEKNKTRNSTTNVSR